MMLAARHDLLTRDQERELVRRRDAGDRSAIDEFVRHNIALAKNYAAKWNGSDMPFEDRLQHALIGLTRAAETFDPDQFGTKFSTHAMWLMSAEVRRAVAYDRQIQIPVHVYDFKARIFAAIAALRAEGQTPTPRAIADRVASDDADNVRPKPSADSIEAFLQVIDGPVSLETPIGGESYSGGDARRLADVVAAPDAEEDDWSEERHALGVIVRGLPPIYRLVLHRRYVGGRTLEEVGEEILLTRERTRQIEVRALHLLRAAKQTGVSPSDGYGFPPVEDETWEVYADQVLGQLPAKFVALKDWARRAWPGNRGNQPMAILKETLAWLLFHNHIERFRNGYRRREVPMTDDLVQTEANQPAGAPEIPVARPKESPMANEWITPADAAKLVGISVDQVRAEARARGWKRRYLGSDPRQGSELWRSDVERYAADRASGKVRTRSRNGASGSTAVKAPPPRRLPTKKAPTPSTSSVVGDLPRAIRWHVDGVQLGKFTATEALEQIAALVGGE